MKTYKYSLLITVILLAGCSSNPTLDVQVYETSASGNALTAVITTTAVETGENITLYPENSLQTITGFGGAFTESSAHLLNRLSAKNRDTIIQAYFSRDGANYSLNRTHMNSCDFSLTNYSYAPVAGDIELKHFSIEEDKDDLIPMIKDAMAASQDGFKLFASPWTASPWMKDNKDWVGGKLLPEYYDTWALFFSEYDDAYAKEGIDIWGFTVENEPLGNGNNWESMHYTADEMTEFVVKHLGPKLEADGKANLKILGYDQNRDHLKEWIDSQYQSEKSTNYFDGTAIHWYASTYDFFPEALQYAHDKAPNKYLIETEGCIDAQVPVWKDDAWYWKKEATDWGWDWAPPEDKHLHPKYAPVNRYARDIIGCLNNWVDGWVDWNMVLDTNGGPNWKANWCIAPVIVDPEIDEVYFTPLYYTMAHFSKYIRPGAKVIETTMPQDKKFMITAAVNPDGSIAVVLFNEKNIERDFNLILGEKKIGLHIQGQAIQTILIN